MELTSLDWVIVVVSLVLCYLPAVFYLRRATRKTAEFFTSGQAAPWWLVGTSMVATTFSTDTPNLVTDFVRTRGVSYNWVWWSFLLTGMATVFFYAQLLQTVFDAGRNQANLQISKVNKDIAIAQYEKAIQTAFREVSDSLAGRATLGEQLRAQAAVANAAQVGYNLADLRYRNGVASYFDLLDAQRTLFSAQQATVQVQSAQAQNLVTLYKVLGGGWTEPSRPN